ncbi:2-keto-4-pentenoate hydratase [Xanthobacter sp. AM11]|uniref:2-keto-4-pentenoate hydratase n=1 Tax=Xanthobacter sp. AM11 TaxID=3380643 RepID=UPI0039BF4121
MTFDDLIAHLDQPGIDSDPARDIIHCKPDLSLDEALALQLAVKRRRVAAGDRIVGHQASFTSKGAQALFPSAPVPMVGTLLASLIRDNGAAVTLGSDEYFIETEIAVLLNRDLEGPDLSQAEVLAGVGGFLPAIEVAPLRSGVREGRYSWPHMVAVQKAEGGYVVLGSRLTSPHTLDISLEGCQVSIDGETRAGATGFEALGNPLAVVAGVARRLHAIGEKLHAGQIIITGSLPPPQVITRSMRVATAHFATLGTVTVRFN